MLPLDSFCIQIVTICCNGPPALFNEMMVIFKSPGRFIPSLENSKKIGLITTSYKLATGVVSGIFKKLQKGYNGALATNSPEIKNPFS